MEFEEVTISDAGQVPCGIVPQVYTLTSTMLQQARTLAKVEEGGYSPVCYYITEGLIVGWTVYVGFVLESLENYAVVSKPVRIIRGKVDENVEEKIQLRYVEEKFTQLRESLQLPSLKDFLEYFATWDPY